MKVLIFLLPILGIFLLTSSDDASEPVSQTIRLVSTEMRPPESLKNDKISDIDIIPQITHEEKTSVGNDTIGKWYVQVVTHTNLDVLEGDTKKIGFTDLIIIQKTGSDTTPQYKVLLGPFNQGECAAMLQRVKGLGFSGSFMSILQN